MACGYGNPVARVTRHPPAEHFPSPGHAPPSGAGLHAVSWLVGSQTWQTFAGFCSPLVYVVAPIVHPAVPPPVPVAALLLAVALAAPPPVPELAVAPPEPEPEPEPELATAPGPELVLVAEPVGVLEHACAAAPAIATHARIRRVGTRWRMARRLLACRVNDAPAAMVTPEFSALT
jgi:hypothetical protein